MADQSPVPPGEIEPIVLDYASRTTREDPSELVTITTPVAFEAQLMRMKLESEDIPCFIANTEMVAAQPFLAIPIRVQVRREDVERAREVLDRPPEVVPDEEYVEEPWRCPTCRRKTIDLMPLSRAQRFRRDAWVVLLVLPVIWQTLPMGQILGGRGDVAWELGLSWVVVAGTLGCLC